VIDSLETCDAPKQGRLAAAARSEERHDLAGGDIKSDVMEHRCSAEGFSNGLH
jgi:hypothetical protein